MSTNPIADVSLALDVEESKKLLGGEGTLRSRVQALLAQRDGYRAVTEESAGLLGCKPGEVTKFIGALFDDRDKMAARVRELTEETAKFAGNEKALRGVTLANKALTKKVAQLRRTMARLQEEIVDLELKAKNTTVSQAVTKLAGLADTVERERMFCRALVASVLDIHLLQSILSAYLELRDEKCANPT